ncbi:ATP-binding cassette domain-containing protein [Paenibacillus tyrfis]|uniref:ABC transporter n=1 Tax=Paenibacillus tyrfis TaxID=1501230 RepID=A0A081P782_9BACL|nr:ABC transporter ATP-binding protein [Paenibacillus tyrfis]KEQ26555.1 ABC transporter [Paenibacillus tyrfis]
MTSPSPLRLERFVKQRDDFRLGPIDVVLEPGLTYALVGPNGSGKTTLLKCLMNLMKPTSGKLEIFGHTYEREEQAIMTQVAFVPDPLDGCEPFTLWQMRDFIGSWYASWDDDDFARRAASFRIPLDKRYGKMSQGERKKAALTLALSTHAPLLLLDEPTNGLDIASRNRLKQMLVEDAEIMERTVVLSTHSVEDIRQFADCILLLRNGALEGPYEKDALVASWSRLWLSREPLPSLADIPGAVDWSEVPFPQLVTCDRTTTLAFLSENGIQVTKEQPLPLDELLDRLLEKSAR